MVTANLILVPGMISIWVPACTDPRRIYRAAYPACMNHIYLQYLGGTTIGRIGFLSHLSLRSSATDLS
jgi:hypothetical protein